MGNRNLRVPGKGFRDSSRVPIGAPRYNRNNKALRLNDHFEEFKDSSTFDMISSGRFEVESPK